LHQFCIKYIEYSKVSRPDTIFGRHDGDMISRNLLKTFPPAKKISNNAYWPSNVRNRVGLKGTTRLHWALEVTRGKQEGTRCIQVSSNWGAPRGNLRFIYKTLYKQGTNVEKDTEGLHKDSMEWLHNGKMVVQNRSRGNDKGLTNLQHN